MSPADAAYGPDAARPAAAPEQAHAHPGTQHQPSVAHQAEGDLATLFAAVPMSGEPVPLEPEDLNPVAARGLLGHARQLVAKAPVALMLYMFSGVQTGTLTVTTPDGRRHVFGGRAPGPSGELNIHSEAVVRHVLVNGEVGFGDAYLDGLWTSPDVAALLTCLYINEPHIQGPYEKNILARVAGFVAHKLKRNTKKGSKKNIAFHYDLGNDFYKLWLDETMAYSSAVFLTPGEPLADAQRRKFDHMLARLDLNAGHRLLEIGSGWGGFAIYAAQQTGCKVVSITLSEEQLVEARRRAAAAGLAGQIEFRIQDYRDVTETFDRVVSIEMYEAVGEEYWPGYFATIEKVLKPGGRAAIQGITIDESIFDNYRTKQDFIQKHVFPGGMLCTPSLFQKLGRQAGLIPEDPRFFAADYAETLRRWHVNVLAMKDQVLKMFDERFLRMWRYYLCYCEAGFTLEKIDLMQITLVKPG